MVPDPGNPQTLNRYSYGLNNPIKYNDPTGHVTMEPMIEGEIDLDCAYSLECRPSWYAPPVNPFVQPRADDYRGETELVRNTIELGNNSERILVESMGSPRHTGRHGQFAGPCKTDGCTGIHPGIDFGAQRGAPVYSSTYGYVVSVGTTLDTGQASFGNYVIVEHDVYGVKYYSIYAHLDTQNVKVGDVVDNTTRIGTVGNTWNQEKEGDPNYHLHYEVRRASNVDLGKGGDKPFKGYYYPDSQSELERNWVDPSPSLP